MWWNLAQFVARILGWGVTLKIMCKIYGGVIPKKLGWIGELVWKSSKLSHNGHRKCTPTPPSRVIIHQPLKRSAFILDHRFKLLNITYPILCSQSPAVWFFGLALTTLLSKRNTALEMTIIYTYPRIWNLCDWLFKCCQQPVCHVMGKKQ